MFRFSCVDSLSLQCNGAWSNEQVGQSDGGALVKRRWRKGRSNEVYISRGLVTNVSRLKIQPNSGRKANYWRTDKQLLLNNKR